MSNTPQEAALEKYALTNKEVCEVSFRAGWYAGAHHERFVRTAKGYEQPTGQQHHSWRQDITEKYEQAKELVLKGFTKREACKMVGMTYDTYLRRQRINIFGRDRFDS